MGTWRPETWSKDGVGLELVRVECAWWPGETEACVLMPSSQHDVEWWAMTGRGTHDAGQHEAWREQAVVTRRWHDTQQWSPY